MHRTSLTTHRSNRRLVSTLFLLVALVATLPATALAQGEPKNQVPFTRTTGISISQASRSLTADRAAGQGESKNELPFTRRVGRTPVTAGVDRSTQVATSPRGEAKNELPFTQSVANPTGGSGSGFSWMDAGLGLVLGISLCVAGLGAAQLVKHKVPRTA